MYQVASVGVAHSLHSDITKVSSCGRRSLHTSWLKKVNECSYSESDASYSGTTELALRMWNDVADTVKPLISDPSEIVFTILRFLVAQYLLFFLCLQWFSLSPKEILLDAPASITRQFQPSISYNLPCNDRDHYETRKILICHRRWVALHLRRSSYIFFPLEMCYQQ